MSFKQEVVLALLNGEMKWMVAFEDLEEAAKYVGLETPTDTGGMLELQQQMVAIQVSEIADAIVRAV